MSINKEYFLPLFKMVSFADMWSNINAKYDQLDFKDNISDEQRIQEYKWITQQIRKYISKQQGVIMKHDSIEEMLKEVEALIHKAEEYGDVRKEIVYNIMRDEWLVEVYRVFEFNLNAEEDEDGWTD